MHLAALDIPALPLQLLLRRHPAWGAAPAVVVEEDRPTAKVLWANRSAQQAGVRPGFSYASALSLCATLHAAPVSPGEIEAAIDEVTARLREFSPHIEPLRSAPGTFFLDARGLSIVFPSLVSWAHAIRDALRELGFLSAVVVGHNRFFCCAVARALRGSAARAFETLEAEQQAANAVELYLLDLEPRVRDSLQALGVTTVGALARLPAAGLKKRYGKALFEFHQLAHGTWEVPVHPEVEREVLAQALHLDEPEGNAERLLFLFKSLLDPLLTRLFSKGESVLRLHLDLVVDRAPAQNDVFTPAEPTLDATVLLNLLKLRLERVDFGGGIKDIALRVDSTRATREQLELFAAQSARDFKAAERAFARLRAAYGDDVVVSAVPRPGHLPEASFTWEPMRKLTVAAPTEVAEAPLIRRKFEQPPRLPNRPGREPDGWLIRGHAHGPVVRACGPYVVSGGWWNREVRREYAFVETERGEVLWVYFDVVRKAWFWAGTVE